MRVFDVTDYSSGLIRGVGRASLAGDFSPHFTCGTCSRTCV
jgi:hypothetical protein